MKGRCWVKPGSWNVTERELPHECSQSQKSRVAQAMTLSKAGETVEALFKKAVLFSKIKVKKFFKEEKLLHEHKPVLPVWIQPSHSMKHWSHKQSWNKTSNTVCSLSRQKEMVHIFILKISTCFGINFPRCVVPCACTWGLSVRPCACRSDKCSELGKRLTPATIWLRFDMQAGTLETRTVQQRTFALLL